MRKQASIIPPSGLVLAGGMGSRLRTILNDGQKVVCPIAGKPFLVYVLQNFFEAGINRIVLALGFRSEEVLESINPFIPEGITIIPSYELTPLGTWGAIKNALPLIETNELLISNGDSLINYPLIDFIFFHRIKRARASMLLCEMHDVSRYGLVEIDENQMIVSFQEKQKNTNSTGLINSGVYMMDRQLISSFSEKANSLETEILPKLCGRRFFGLATKSAFIDIGIPEDYYKADDFLRNRAQGSV